MKRLRLEDRQEIQVLVQKGLSPVDIAKVLNRSRRTILYELSRNGTKDKGYADYNADIAHKMCWSRRSIAPAEKVYSEVLEMKERIIAIEENLKLLIELFKSTKQGQ